MIRKLLIANRGEIAVRIIRACREMGIATVAVYSEADEESLHTQLADEAICIGPGPSAQSYLNMEQIISATMVSGADAIHPGFGFLSENARFAELCEKCGITFVGPPSKVIRMLGNKKIARSTMIAAGVPVVPGSEGDVEDIETGLKEAERIGYPVIIKAALGGGGKGMRVANTPEEFPEAYATARKESEIAFGDGTMYIEHFVVNPRHIEFQILADSFGNVIHLGERDCSIKRKNGACGGDGGESSRLRKCGNDRISSGTGWKILVYGNEYKDPGGASGDRVGNRNRSCKGAAEDRFRNAS